MIKILCIDDTPDEVLTSGKSLREVITEVFKDTPYKVLFKTTGRDGIKTAEEDSEISLALLDVEFNKKIEGPEIADKLEEKAPQTKIIVLTRLNIKGKRTEFGWKPNVVKYVLKNDLTNPRICRQVRNLACSVIEDYENRNWELEYSGPCAINLTNKKTEETFGINIPSMAERPLIECMKFPNKPVSWVSDMSTADLSRVHNAVNTNVLESTEWKIWGILTKDKCAKGQLKLVVGSVKPFPSESSTANIYVLQSHFEKFKKDIEKRLYLIEQALNLKTPKSK